MAKPSSFLTPARLTFVLLALFVVLGLISKADQSINYITAISVGGVLGLVAVIVEYKRNNIGPDNSEFKVSMLPYGIGFVVGLVGMLGPNSKERFFMVVIIGILLVFWIGIIVIQFRYKQKATWR